MDYKFNFDFLPKWMKENRKTRKDVLKVLGNQDYKTLNRWLDGIEPMHIKAMLKFCNYYNINLGCFFTDEEVVISPQRRIESRQVTESTELLQLQLDHEKELRRLQEQSHQREDDLRRDYEQRLRKRDDRIDEILSQHHQQIELIQHLLGRQPQSSVAPTAKKRKPSDTVGGWTASEALDDPKPLL